jgi:hypothetical protein
MENLSKLLQHYIQTTHVRHSLNVRPELIIKVLMITLVHHAPRTESIQTQKDQQVV